MATRCEFFVFERDGERQRRRHDGTIELPEIRPSQYTVVVRHELHESRVLRQLREAMAIWDIDRHGSAQGPGPSWQALVGAQLRWMRQDDSACLAAGF